MKDSPAPRTHEMHAFEFHEMLDAHRHESRLSDIILGGQDGLVNVLGVILGVAAATNDPRIVLAAGMAATFAESVSMGAVAYTSTQADRALYESEMAREHRHVHLVPAIERDEIRKIYQGKGFEGALLDQIVETITANKDVWVAVMMAEELRLVPTHHGAAWQSAVVVGLAAIIGSLIPLAPFMLMPVVSAMVVSILVAAIALFAVGAYKARMTVGHWGKSGMEMALIGTLSALVGYVVGLFFRAPTAP